MICQLSEAPVTTPLDTLHALFLYGDYMCWYYSWQEGGGPSHNLFWFVWSVLVLTIMDD